MRSIDVRCVCLFQCATRVVFWFCDNFGEFFSACTLQGRTSIATDICVGKYEIDGEAKTKQNVAVEWRKEINQNKSIKEKMKTKLKHLG